MNERMDERYGLDTPQEREREDMDLRAKYEALEKDRDSWKGTVESIALMAGMVASETWGVLDILTHVREMREENADLKARERKELATEDAGWGVALDALEKERDDLKAQVARLSAPVTDAEWGKQFAFTHNPINGALSHRGVNDLIAARTAPAKETE